MASARRSSTPPPSTSASGPSRSPCSGPAATRSRPTSSSPTTLARRSCARSPSRISCPPTGPPSPSSTPGPGAAWRPCCGRSGAGTTRVLPRSWPRRPPSSADSAGTTTDCRRASAGSSAEQDPTPHFTLYDEQANYAGRARHLMLALGHGPLAYPPALAKAREDPALADRIVQAYEPKAYAPGGRYVVIGAGIASVNEWANALDTGAKVISLLRSPTPDEQDLNTPRCFFEALGIDAFQGLPFDRRLALPGPDPQGHSAQPPGLGAAGPRGPRPGPLRAAHGRDRRGPPRAGRAAHPRRQPQRARPGLARRHRAWSPAPASRSPG